MGYAAVRAQIPWLEVLAGADDGPSGLGDRL